MVGPQPVFFCRLCSEACLKLSTTRLALTSLIPTAAAMLGKLQKHEISSLPAVTSGPSLLTQVAA